MIKIDYNDLWFDLEKGVATFSLKDRNTRRVPDLYTFEVYEVVFHRQKNSLSPSEDSLEFFIYTHTHTHIHIYTYRIPSIRRYNVGACVFCEGVASTLDTIDMRGSVSRASAMRTSSRRENRTIISLESHCSYPIADFSVTVGIAFIKWLSTSLWSRILYYRVKSDIRGEI